MRLDVLLKTCTSILTAKILAVRTHISCSSIAVDQFVILDTVILIMQTFIYPKKGHNKGFFFFFCFSCFLTSYCCCSTNIQLIFVQLKHGFYYPAIPSYKLVVSGFLGCFLFI